jgi:thioredoxin reductase (NADPH)
MSELNDVIIIGSGPSGYTAAIYAARAQLKPIVLEGSVTMGGALMNTTEVENFPGFIDGIMGPELMMNMRAQAERFGAKLITDDAMSVEMDGDFKRVTDGSGRTYLARTIILAMGSAFRELGVAGEKRLSGHGVSWCATCDGFFFRGQTVAVIGGGDSAVEEATFLTRFADKVYLVHRRDQLRASKVMISRAEADPKIEFVWNSEVLEVLGDAKVSGIRLRNTFEGTEATLDVTGVFVAIGHDPRNELVKNTIDIDAGGYVKVTCGSTATNVDGVFACGDLVDHSYRQAITAAGTGCSAALDSERWLSHQKDNL